MQRANDFKLMSNVLKLNGKSIDATDTHLSVFGKAITSSRPELAVLGDHCMRVGRLREAPNT